MKHHLWKNKLLIIILCGILWGVEFGASAAICLPTGSSYCNPLGETVDIIKLTQVILGYLLKITIPLAVLGIIVSGLYYIFASVSGNAGKTTQAKGTFMRILAGSALVVGANALALAIINFLKNLP